MTGSHKPDGRFADLKTMWILQEAMLVMEAMGTGAWQGVPGRHFQ